MLITFTVPKKHQLRDQLRQQTLHLPYDDQEQHMEEIRYFCRSCTLRVAAAEIIQTLTLMEVSDQLTWTAEVVVEHVTHIACNKWRQNMVSPVQQIAHTARHPGFIVVAYGKMGGIEMGYQSDLDLVFLHENAFKQTQGGSKSIDSSTFYTRLVGVLFILSTSTASGRAYEIDMRLRPQVIQACWYDSQWICQIPAARRLDLGASSLGSIKGDYWRPKTMARFDKIRTEQLCRSRDLSQLRKEVLKCATKCVNISIKPKSG